MSRILVISPHPDDEAVGCGGTLRRHVLDGDEVRVIHLTSGEQGGHGMPPEETARVREQEAAEAAGILGVNTFEFWHLPDGALRATTAAVNRLSGVLSDWRPGLTYVTHDGEMHPDHRAAARLVKRATLQTAACGSCPVMMYEVWTPMQDMDHIEDITPHIETKLTAIRAYRCQTAVVGFEEAFRGLARYRGEMHSWPGGPYAEIFRRQAR